MQNKKAHGQFISILLIFLMIISLNLDFPDKSKNQYDKVWGDKKCAVVLTYDDALGVHLDKVIPALDSFGFTGTFYIYGNAPFFNARLNDWKTTAANGHELGNHTLFHPCNSRVEGNDWVKAEYDLNNYTVKRITDEIKLANTLLEATDGKKKRTFAYPCGDKLVADTFYLNLLKKDFVAARGTTPGMNYINKVDLLNIKAYGIEDGSGGKLIKLVKKAKKEQALLVIMFHGVGGEHGLNIPLAEHNKFLKYLDKNKQDIWIAPMVEIAEHIKHYNKHKKNTEINN